jgi:hypothetical protein
MWATKPGRSPRRSGGSPSGAPSRRGTPGPSGLDSDPADLPLILPVVRAGIEWTAGNEWARGLRPAITKPQADLIVRIVRATPDIPPGEAYRLSLTLTRPPGMLEMYLAYAPWRDAGAAYVEAWRNGWIRTFSYNPFTPDPMGGTVE